MSATDRPLLDALNEALDISTRRAIAAAFEVPEDMLMPPRPDTVGGIPAPNYGEYGDATIRAAYHAASRAIEIPSCPTHGQMHMLFACGSATSPNGRNGRGADIWYCGEAGCDIEFFTGWGTVEVGAARSLANQTDADIEEIAVGLGYRNHDAAPDDPGAVVVNSPILWPPDNFSVGDCTTEGMPVSAHAIVGTDWSQAPSVSVGTAVVKIGEKWVSVGEVKNLTISHAEFDTELRSSRLRRQAIERMCPERKERDIL